MRLTIFMTAWLLAVVSADLRAQKPAPIKPPALRPGDTIALVAPAGPLERDRVEWARGRLHRLGFHLQVPKNIFRKRGYLAGDDQVRAEELMAAFRDPTVKAIFPGTGGYGTTRILDLLDYDVIRRNPKILLGFSDITGLHLALQRKTGLITFHGPLLMYGLGSRENLTEFSAEYLWRALLAKSYFDWAGDPVDEGYSYFIPPEVATVRTISPGKARGRLTGGNLSLVCTLMGTEYEIDTDGKILFLEDTNEEPYRIDRYLSQLRLGGKFDKVAGVMLGHYTGCESKKGEDSLTLEHVLADYFSELRVPVIVNFPAGHNRQNTTLPMNAMVELDADARRVRVLENPVQLGTPPAPTGSAPVIEPPDEPLPSEPGEAPATPASRPQTQSAAPAADLPAAQFEPVRPSPPRPPPPQDVRRQVP